MEVNMEFDGNKPKFISFYEHESEIARSEIGARRWMVAALIAFVALVMSNVGWLLYEMQFSKEVTSTVEATSDSGDAYGTLITGDDSEVNYGVESKGNDNN